MTSDPKPELRLQFGECDSPSDVIDALALLPFLDGTQPYARSLHLHRLRRDATLVPSGVVSSREAVSGDHRALLLKGHGWTLSVSRWTAQAWAVLVCTAVDAALAERVLAEAARDACEPARDADEAVPVGFWHLARHGGQRRERDIEVVTWPAIRRNYTRAVCRAFERLMGLRGADITGRMLLLHGPPGTGKTTALRALAHAWRAWCCFDYVLDPERLLKEPSYLMNAALGSQDGADDDDAFILADEVPVERKRWRLLLLEDCDELLRDDAKKEVGPSLGRLLNITDGFPGQGLRLIIAITTNEPLARLHPAVTRPGRCIAQIEVGRLDADEARAWLGREAKVGPEGVTLAELYAQQGALEVVEGIEPRRVAGLYL